MASVAADENIDMKAITSPLVIGVPKIGSAWFIRVSCGGANIRVKVVSEMIANITSNAILSRMGHRVIYRRC